MVKSIPFVSVLALYWKWILFLASEVFREWRSYCRDGEMFVKNAFLPCSPQKTTELCAELDNLGVQPWNIPAAAQIVWRTLLSPLWLWTSTRGAALVKQPSLLFWTLNTLGGPLSSSCVLKLWFSMIYKDGKKYGFWICASCGSLNLSICSKECWVACPTICLPPFFARLLQHIFPVGYDRKHTWSQATWSKESQSWLPESCRMDWSEGHSFSLYFFINLSDTTKFQFFFYIYESELECKIMSTRCHYKHFLWPAALYVISNDPWDPLGYKYLNSSVFL